MKNLRSIYSYSLAVTVFAMMLLGTPSVFAVETPENAELEIVVTVVDDIADVAETIAPDKPTACCVQPEMNLFASQFILELSSVAGTLTTLLGVDSNGNPVYTCDKSRFKSSLNAIAKDFKLSGQILLKKSDIITKIELAVCLL